jgi:hypothetical protein
MGDPAMMEGMMGAMKGNVAMMVPQTLIMGWINAFFAGFVLCKLGWFSIFRVVVLGVEAGRGGDGKGKCGEGFASRRERYGCLSKTWSEDIERGRLRWTREEAAKGITMLMEKQN